MDTKEMLGIVDMLADLKPFFRGIFASNSLPVRVTQFPSAVVCNTDPIEEKVLIGLPFGSETKQNANFTTALEDYRNTMTFD